MLCDTEATDNQATISFSSSQRDATSIRVGSLRARGSVEQLSGFLLTHHS
jgi:hypothetical protein